MLAAAFPQQERGSALRTLSSGVGIVERLSDVEAAPLGHPPRR